MAEMAALGGIGRRLQKRLVYGARRRIDERARALRVALDVERHMARLMAQDYARPRPAAERRRIREYARETFGSEAYYPWLHFYAVYAGEFREGWVPEDYFQSVAMPFVNGVYHKVCLARTLQARLLNDPSMPDVAHQVGGRWHRPDGEPIPDDRVEATLFADDDEIVLKAEATHWGKGVSFLRRADFDPARVAALGNLVAQRPIRQHPWLEAVFPGAVATLRVSTGRPPGGEPRLLGSVLRLGLGNARSIGVESIEAPVRGPGGALAPYALDPETWVRHARHPDTGFVFEGQVMPGHDRIVAHCLALHRRLPQFGFIGWDATLDRDDRVQVMEFNTFHPETKTVEMEFGPAFIDFDLKRYADKRIRDVWA